MKNTISIHFKIFVDVYIVCVRTRIQTCVIRDRRLCVNTDEFTVNIQHKVPAEASWPTNVKLDYSLGHDEHSK